MHDITFSFIFFALVSTLQPKWPSFHFLCVWKMKVHLNITKKIYLTSSILTRKCVLIVECKMCVNSEMWNVLNVLKCVKLKNCVKIISNCIAKFSPSPSSTYTKIGIFLSTHPSPNTHHHPPTHPNVIAKLSST